MKSKYKPYSDNIIFFDTEFSGNDLGTGEILSIGMVKMNGDELYLELEHEGSVSNWVKRNIIPTLRKTKVSKLEATKQIKKFIGKDKSYLMSYVIPYDTVYIHKLFGFEKFERLKIKTWPVDFSSILFAYGFDPDGLKGGGLEEIARLLDINITKYKLHNALDDAKLLRDVYLKIIKNE